jgi:N-acetylglucosaminyldiphosphoundecaprenol N-acetyl-beta-D-mannosaminyltransferase
MLECTILGVTVDEVTQEGVEERILGSVRQKRKDVYSYVNIHAVNLAYQYPRFRRILNAAWTTYCDGEGVRLGARILGFHLPRRIVLSYWVWRLCEIFERENVSIFLLGSRAENVALASTILSARFPRLRIAGYHHGYFDKSSVENDGVLAMIEHEKPDVLFVGFGMPLQEYWIEENLERIRAAAILSCGSMIDYVAGVKPLTPTWMANHGLEWLYRLLREPGRLWRRYLIGNPLFLLRVLSEKASSFGRAR